MNVKIVLEKCNVPHAHEHVCHYVNACQVRLCTKMYIELYMLGIATHYRVRARFLWPIFVLNY